MYRRARRLKGEKEIEKIEKKNGHVSERSDRFSFFAPSYDRPYGFFPKFFLPFVRLRSYTYTRVFTHAVVFDKIIIISYAYTHPHVCGHDENAVISGMTSAMGFCLYVQPARSEPYTGVEFADDIVFNINNNDIWSDFIGRIKYPVRTPKTTWVVSGNGIALQNGTICRDNLLCRNGGRNRLIST